MFYGTSILENDFEHKKGTPEYAGHRFLYETAWFFVWIAFIIPAILILSAIVFCTVYFACCGKTWAIILVIAAIAGWIRGGYKKP